MYAVIKTGGKQYRVSEGDQIKIEKLEGDIGTEVVFDEVLMVGEGESVKIGTPTVDGGQVKAEVAAQGRGDKVHIIKHNRRKHHHKEQGHRQYFTEVKITQITGA